MLGRADGASVVGSVDGAKVGNEVSVGDEEAGFAVGSSDGLLVGVTASDGAELNSLGATFEGSVVGNMVDRATVGKSLGSFDGFAVGSSDGVSVGIPVADGAELDSLGATLDGSVVGNGVDGVVDGKSLGL